MELLGLVNLPDWFLWLLLVFTTFYIYYTWHFNTFKALGIPGPTPYPAIGTIHLAIKHGMRDLPIFLTKKYGKVFGSYGGRLPELTVSDPKILRQVLIKDFPNFVNRRVPPLRGTFADSIFDIKGARWKHMRAHLTPAFSTGKLKYMMHGITDCAESMTKNLEKSAETGEIFEARDVAQGYSMDVIARTVFGLNLTTQDEMNQKFLENARVLFKFSFISPYIFIMIFLPFLLPILTGVFRIKSSMPQNIESFFRKFVIDLLEERRSNPQKYNDLVQLMLNSEEDLKMADSEVKEDLGGEISEETRKKGLTTEEIISNCFLLLIGGYETTGTTLAFAMYELAVNPDVQEKVLAELDEVLEDKEKVTYEDVAKLTYMEMVVYETLRLFPPFPQVDREARCDVEYEGVKIPAGMPVVYPILVMQMDPEVYPEPEKFIPERFSPEEKAKRDPLYFAAFGTGPRNCAGTRLAMMEVKMALAVALRKFRLLSCEKTPIPVVIEKQFFPIAEGGLHLKVESR